MAVRPPAAMQDVLKSLRPEPEQHQADPDAHCINPKCGYHFDARDEQEIMTHGVLICPQCGTSNDYRNEMYTGKPGGNTKARITLKDMGDIGEAVVASLGSIPGVGSIMPASDQYKFPIDFIIEGDNGTRYGVEVKTNHSEAQQRFKIGGKAERQKKIDYCYKNGLKPALVGVRLNFFDDTADVFFREGLTDTWVGNAAMRHVAQANFAQHNPFKTPEEHAALQAAPPPDQSMEGLDKRLDEMFGPAPEGSKPTPSGTFSSFVRYPWDDNWEEVTASERDPDWIFVYYMGNLRVEEWHHNRRFTDMAEELLRENDTTIPSFAPDLDSTDFVGGEMVEYADGSMELDVKGMSKPEVVQDAKRALMEWMQEKGK